MKGDKIDHARLNNISTARSGLVKSVLANATTILLRINATH
ncbi:hypothetical protein SAMN04488690_1657 [Stenotrophomonas indicatrix]|uniref:Uncharacterized protein n=1 Tax=Stenotrophomonas indicatrix TaxID=2045451 RepID=A0A1W1GX87_9GAMM|nr:hypothetical protein SAMN04488690_1657 [Stenotrophomonas indicatrix]